MARYQYAKDQLGQVVELLIWLVKSSIQTSYV